MFLPETHAASFRRGLTWFVGTAAGLMIIGYAGLSHSAPVRTAFLSLLAAAAAALASARSLRGMLWRLIRLLAGLVSIWATAAMWGQDWVFILAVWAAAFWPDIRALWQTIRGPGDKDKLATG